MRILIQKVLESTLRIDQQVYSQIGKGLLVFVGIEDADTQEDIDWLSHKIINIRLFEDENQIMNKSVVDIQGDILLVSQFTLQAMTKKGNRPSYIKASKPEFAEPMYKKLILAINQLLGKEIKTGQFGADMKISLINDGPTTIWIDSKNKE